MEGLTSLPFGEKTTETTLFKLLIQIFQPPVFNFKYTVHPNNLLRRFFGAPESNPSKM